MLLAKLYFHLGNYEESLGFALKAGQYFDVRVSDELTQILINKCIEKYTLNQRSGNIASAEHKQYVAVVNYVIDSHLSTGDFKLVFGIALDSRDLSLFSRVVNESVPHAVLMYTLPFLKGFQFRGKWISEALRRVVFEECSPEQSLVVLEALLLIEDYKEIARLITVSVRNNLLEQGYSIALEVGDVIRIRGKVLQELKKELQESKELTDDLVRVLEGRFANQCYNSFAKGQARIENYYFGVLKKVDAKYSVAHGSALLSLSMLLCSTQDESFLTSKENMDWAMRCSHWAKFSSVASLGLIFRNTRSRSHVTKFLPEANTGNTFPQYGNGGSLMALGFIFCASADETTLNYLLDITRNPTHNQHESVIHGACLGLGLTAFASCHEGVGDRLRDILNTASSVTGEAAALSLGLLYAGSNNQLVLADLLAATRDFDHQKIIRSACLAIGLVCFQSPSEEFLLNLEQNPTTILAIPHYCASAYFQSSNPIIVRKLFVLSNHISNDVKRAALIALGFVMHHNPELVNLIKMLLYSYNPHVRYGCVMALAVGAPDPIQAVQLIWPSLTDSTEFVRQSAFIAIGLLLQVSNDPKVTQFRTFVEELISKPYLDLMVKMGAILSVGLLDIGGRNLTVSLKTQGGLPRIEAVAGLLVFTQYWNWFPFINFISLALRPSAFIGVTAKLQTPIGFQLKSNCKPSTFDYPLKIVKEEKRADDRKDNAKELSTTTKAKARALRKKNSEMEVEGLKKRMTEKNQEVNQEGTKTERIIAEVIVIQSEKGRRDICNIEQSHSNC